MPAQCCCSCPRNFSRISFPYVQKTGWENRFLPLSAAIVANSPASQNRRNANMPLVSVLNAMDLPEFVSALGNAVEHFPVAAAAVWFRRPFASGDDLAAAFDAVLDELPPDAKRGVLGVHPDLAGRLAEAGGLTAESAREQSSAGLLDIDEDEKTKMRNLNRRLKHIFVFFSIYFLQALFGFMAVVFL